MAAKSMNIPDMRFEPTYLRSIASNGQIQSKKTVLWVTVRDQVISPLLQGIIWYALLSN
jgi:hypothetical protein